MTNPASPAPELPTSDCTICTHPRAAEIDAGLLAGTPIRTVAETHGVSRSAVHRHKQNHLSVEAITDEPVGTDREPLRIVDVHQSLTALADRLEKVVEQAARTRKATAAVAAFRELRQTLVAIADLQATEELQLAASRDRLLASIDGDAGQAIVRMFDLILAAFGFETRNGSPRDYAVSDLMVQCLRCIDGEGTRTDFGSVDTTKAREFVEQQALESAESLEREVERRVRLGVEAELRRRENQARPALEAGDRLAIEAASAVADPDGRADDDLPSAFVPPLVRPEWPPPHDDGFGEGWRGSIGPRL